MLSWAIRHRGARKSPRDDPGVDAREGRIMTRLKRKDSPRTIRIQLRESFRIKFGLGLDRMRNPTAPMFENLLSGLDSDGAARERVAKLFAALGLEIQIGVGLVAAVSGLFSEGFEFWGRDGKVSAVVTYPTSISKRDDISLRKLNRLPGVQVIVDNGQTEFPYCYVSVMINGIRDNVHR
jgi:hypothetical protein